MSDNCKTKDCNGTVVNEAIGYCQYCADELWAKEAEKKLDPFRPMVSQKPKEVSQPVKKVSLPVKDVTNGNVTPEKSVTKKKGVTPMCSKCHKNPRTKSSKSYCKECHAERVKKWRKKDEIKTRLSD